MQRKDKKPKAKALRNMPEYQCGFREAQSAIGSLLKSDGPSVLGGVVSVLSLFSGCGGLDLGFEGGFDFMGTQRERLPFRILAAYDNLRDAVECYRLNISTAIHEADLTNVGQEELPDADVLLGGFPCQDFSSSGPKTGFEGKRGELYKVLLSYMEAHHPKIVVGENVNYLARLRNGEYLRTILSDFEGAGYHFDVWEMYAPDYGIPQSRRRLFLIGVRNDIAGFPKRPTPTTPTKPMTISEALRDLECVHDETVPNQSQYFVSSKATGGGGQGDDANDPDKVSYCIRANARGRIQFHYSLPRRLTVRECARLQTFPDTFIFPFTTQRNLTLIGNAVPPVLAHHVAQSIAAFLSAAKAGQPTLHVTDHRTYPIQQKLFA